MKNSFKSVKQFSSKLNSSKIVGSESLDTTSTLYVSNSARNNSKSDNDGASTSKSTSNSSLDQKNYVKSSSTPTSASTYVVLLPYILNEDFIQVKQPILAKLRNRCFSEFGFELPFNSFFDEKRNNFTFELFGEIFTAQLIAVGDSSSELRQSLQKTTRLNPLWQNLPKIVGNPDMIITLNHSPLLNEEDIPNQQVICSAKLEKFIAKVKSQSRKEAKSHSQEARSSSNLKEVAEKPRTESNSSGITDSVVDVRAVKNVNCSKNNNKTCVALESTDSVSIEQRLEILNQKKVLLSDSDIFGSTLKVTIDVITSMYKVITEKNTGIPTAIIMQVSSNDETYTIKKKNKIFIEGKIELDLNKYEQAVMKSKTKDPNALAYQMIHTAFPEVYYSNVTLGKKFYDESEIKCFSEKRQDSKEKHPLVYIWGYSDPYNKPFEGDFDYIRGQERIRALIDHIFRKSDLYQYDEEKENKVRQRMVKEFCQKNLKIAKKNKEAIQDSEADENLLDPLIFDDFETQ